MKRILITNKLVSMMLIPILFAGLGCANAPQKTSTQTAETNPSNAVAIQAEAINFVEIDFKPGSSQLTEDAKKSVKSVISQASQSGKIDEVMVLSWSDYEYPSKKISKLPKAQRNLAEKRNTALTEYIKDIRTGSVDSYNMAERPNSFSKLFNTDDNKLKNALVAAGLPTTAEGLQKHPKASKSVVLLTIQ